MIKCYQCEIPIEKNVNMKYYEDIPLCDDCFKDYIDLVAYPHIELKMTFLLGDVEHISKVELNRDEFIKQMESELRGNFTFEEIKFDSNGKIEIIFDRHNLGGIHWAEKEDCIRDALEQSVYYQRQEQWEAVQNG